MRVLVLTSSRRGTASRVLGAIAEHGKIEVAAVVLAHGVSPNRRSLIKRKLAKVTRIGLLGTLNGLRIRSWYADNDTEDIGSLCERAGIPLVETPCINCKRTADIFRSAKADLGLSLSNGYIGKRIFTIPRLGMVNVHTEILPEFQGAQSIIWPIHNGLRETGFTIHQVERRIDAGRILVQARSTIRFFPSLKETVRENLALVRARVPAAMCDLCENYEAIYAGSIPQSCGVQYSTPSIWQFLRMLLMHRRMYRESLHEPRD